MGGVEHDATSGGVVVVVLAAAARVCMCGGGVMKWETAMQKERDEERRKWRMEEKC